ncbi:MAG: hypothetical protein Q9163_003563 [Psora crenata]
MNLSGSLNAFRMLVKPSLCLPHSTVSTFDQIPIPIRGSSGWPDIKAVVLDKDNCFAVPQANSVYNPYEEHFQSLRKRYPGPRLLIVSNSTGTRGGHDGGEVGILERNTGVKVFRHSTKKPGCGLDVLRYFCAIPETGVRKGSDIAIVGDRLFTDVMMANLIGAWSIWIKDGVVVQNGILSRMEKGIPPFLEMMGFKLQLTTGFRAGYKRGFRLATPNFTFIQNIVSLSDIIRGLAPHYWWLPKTHKDTFTISSYSSSLAFDRETCLALMESACDMSAAAPSPPTNTPPNGTSYANSSRRPPRKSTLTQQQKNQKRQRATQDQLATLEVEFNKNPTPTATVRDRIAQDINMTERSVQIWFQNRSVHLPLGIPTTALTVRHFRRAKIKQLAKKSIETGEDCDAIPDSMRQYLANQALESGKPLAGEFPGRSPGQISPYPGAGMFLGESVQPGKIVIHHFTCKSLSIGSWRRVGQNAMDLVVFYAPDKACLTYYINNEGAGYKIEYPFSYIKSISLENNDSFDTPNVMPTRPRGLLVELNRPPNFFMDSAGTGGFHQCGDFTEGQQASSVMVHHLGGHPRVLSGQLAKLVSLESFQNRHSPFERQVMASSAPVSPMGPPRPSSQPTNQMTHPHLAMFQEQGFGMAPPARGHKRQRSRSVPVAVDFNAMPLMPSFHIQKPSVNMTAAENLYAPIPQHSNSLGPLGPNLRIDTSSGYGLDYRQYPVSAATTNSPSEYASPSFFSGSHIENVTAAPYTPSYSLPFLSPMGEHHPSGIQPSVSPLSTYSHGDPVIANGSPPMGDMHRSPSTDLLSISQDHPSAMSEEGLLLSEMYSKQNLNLAMHSPTHPLDDAEMKFQMQEESSSEELDMHNLVHFNHMDHTSLSPERTTRDSVEASDEGQHGRLSRIQSGQQLTRPDIGDRTHEGQSNLKSSEPLQDSVEPGNRVTQSSPDSHGSPPPAPPNPIFETKVGTIKSHVKTLDGQESSLSPLSPKSIPSIPVKRITPVKSPLSPRTRYRGFSLRKSLLARTVPEELENSKCDFIELDRVEGPSNQQSEKCPSKNGSSLNKPVPSVPVSSNVKFGGDGPRRPYFAKISARPISLPYYENWAKKRSPYSNWLARCKEWKENTRKSVLRIHDLPPSKAGRHVPLDPGRGKPLTDERRAHEYISNTIRSSRYTLYNFVPRQLFAQFSKLANFYFLCVSILQMIPGLSTTGTYTTIVPLLFFVTISIAKEGYDDLRRYKLDRAENRRTSHVLHAYRPMEVALGQAGATDTVTADGPRQWAKVKWQDLKVGDVVKLDRDEAAPADLVLLQAQGTETIAYIETTALDGETNLKTKQPSPPLARSCKTSEDIARCKAHVVVEDPNLDLYNFEGKVILEGETLPLTNNEIIYRGSVLRNTSEAMGMVIYTGEECKIRMNATKNPRIKAPALQSEVNKIVIMMVIFVIALSIFNTVAYQIWQETTEDEAWYLTDARVAFFPILTSFIILFNTLIPLSLYVSLEIVKLFQMFFMNDIDMYDEASDTPMEARTSTINEELGQVNYIFSDKTGTLTNNSMRFRKMSVAGTAWLHDTDIKEERLKDMANLPNLQGKRNKGKSPVRRSKSSTSCAPAQRVGKSGLPAGDPAGHNGSITSCWRSSAKPNGFPKLFNTQDLLHYIQRQPYTNFARRVEIFLLSMALCHTCFPETKVDGATEYQAASPDEQALVRAAQELGYIVVDRQNGTITIKTLPSGPDSDPVFTHYQVLDVIEFSSTRKRMSVIVRMPSQRICLFCKGADSIIMHLLRLSGLALAKAVEVEQRLSRRQSLEAQEAIRRASESRNRQDSLTRTSLSMRRTSIGGIRSRSMSVKRLQPIRDEIDQWLSDQENDVDLPALETDSVYYSPRPSAQVGLEPESISNSLDGQPPFQRDRNDDLIEQALVAEDDAVFERCFQHVNDFATEGLRTLLYGHRYIDEEEYRAWKKLYLHASTSLVDRQRMIEEVGAIVERDLELTGATAIEDKLQSGVPEAIEKLRRAKIKLWMLTGDKRETAVNIGRSCRLIKDYSFITILDHESGEVSQRIAAATLEINRGTVAHSVVVVDGQTLSQISADEPLRKLFVSLAILVDTVICCRASPSQKASLVHSIRSKVKNAVTLAIGDGANDIAMIQEAHVGIGITGKEGLQAARTSDYSIAQFRFLTKLLLVHGRWNYIRTCKYTLGTFWKEILFYLTQALYQRYAGYTGTSLYESWSLSMFNTLFTSLPVIFIGIFEQDLSSNTLMAVPELYSSLGPRNAGFNVPVYLGWVFMASSQAVIVFFIMLGLFGQAPFPLNNGLFAMGALSFSACIIVIASKMQFWEIHNKTYTCVIAMIPSIGGWFLWNIALSASYTYNVIYDVRDGFLRRFGRYALWWLTLILIVTACWALEIGMKVVKCTWMPSDADSFRELEKDEAIQRRFAQAAGSRHHHEPPSAHTMGTLQCVRTADEEIQREGEVQELLDRPRHMRHTSGTDELDFPDKTVIRRRQKSESEALSREPKVSFVVEQRKVDGNEEDEDMNGKQKPPRRSTDVQELLRRGFGSVRRSLDIV